MVRLGHDPGTIFRGIRTRTFWLLTIPPLRIDKFRSTATRRRTIELSELIMHLAQRTQNAIFLKLNHAPRSTHTKFHFLKLIFGEDENEKC